MLNGVHLHIMMLRNQPEFCLMADDDENENQAGYLIRIEDAFLRLTKLKINPAILVSHSSFERGFSKISLCENRAQSRDYNSRSELLFVGYD